MTARAGGVATVTVPMDCAWSASGPPGSLYADAYQSLPNVCWGTQQPLLGTVAPQAYPRQGHRPCLPWPLCPVLSSLLFITNRQEPAWGHPVNSWWACNPSTNRGNLPLAPQAAQSVFPSLFCSPHTCLQATHLNGTLGSLEAGTASILASPQSPCLAQSRHPEKKTACMEWQGFRAPPISVKDSLVSARLDFRAL